MKVPSHCRKNVVGVDDRERLRFEQLGRRRRLSLDNFGLIGKGIKGFLSDSLLSLVTRPVATHRVDVTVGPEAGIVRMNELAGFP